MAYQAIDDHGIDVFSGSVVINWGLVEEENIQMVYIKATEGIAYTNPIMTSQYEGAKNAGILVGFYHFAATNNPTLEYKYFMNSISKFKQDLKPCLDYEIINTDYGFIKQFMAQNSNLILYAPHSIADHTGFPISKIWIPEPNTFPLTTRGYAGIQYSSTGIVNGISNDVSLDIFDTEILEGNVTPPSPVFNGNLGVYTIQHHLNSMILAGLQTDGLLGPLTIAKIKKFEEVVGITIDGIWGPQCQNATVQIFAKLLCGLPYIERIPTRLIQFRMGIAIDGIFGPITVNSVKVWQKSNGLVPDGIFGPLSWSKLLK